MSYRTEPFREVAVTGDRSRSPVRCSILDLDNTAQGYSRETEKLCFWLPQKGQIDIRPKGTPKTRTIANGLITILPPSTPWQGSWIGKMRGVSLAITPALIQECSDNPIHYPRDQDLPVYKDNQIKYMLMAMYRALASPEGPSDLFTHHIARAVTYYYLQCYCKASKPAEPGTKRLSKKQMSRLTEFIESELNRKLKIEQLSGTLNMSCSTFCRLFKKTTGIPPYRYVQTLRIQRAKTMLRDSARPLSEIAFSLGFYDQSQFSNTFRRVVGVTPRTYRQRH